MNNHHHTLINLSRAFLPPSFPTPKTMATLQLNSHSSLLSKPYISSRSPNSPNHLNFSRFRRIRAVQTVQSEALPAAAAAADEIPAVDFAFVSSVLLPDGTPDVHYRTASGGQKLREIMLDNEIELYGPYSRPLLNCGGGGTCATCMVEVVEGTELLNPRTDKEREKLKRKPKNWRLACQTTVGKPDSRGLVVIQQLPEWKAHEWSSGKEEPPEDQITYI